MVMRTVFRVLLHPRAYLNLVSVFVAALALFPIGIAAFVATVVGVAVPVALAITPFLFGHIDVNFEPIVVDTIGEALAISFLGLMLLLLELHLANGIAHLFRRFVFIRIGRLRIGG